MSPWPAYRRAWLPKPRAPRCANSRGGGKFEGWKDGPGVEQMIDAMRDPLSETTIKALPAHGLYAQALR